jgi:uncharacterized protein YndB with AHSA1/START domain
MTEPKTAHATIVIERSFDASPACVFEAFADPEARMRWGTPSADTRLVYLETDFRVGGRDVSRCGPAGNLIFYVELTYLDIVSAARIVSVETVSQDETRLSVSLITVELQASGRGTRLVLTDQIAALDGSDMVAGSRAGFNAALDNLAGELRRRAEEAA